MDGGGVAFLLGVLATIVFLVYANHQKTKDQGPPRPGGPAPKSRYVDSGYQLTRRMISELSLLDWAGNRPTFTPPEQAFIDRTMGQFQVGSKEFAKSQGGEEVAWHPEVWEQIKRALVEFALRDCAERGQADREEWRESVSTYLKAWAVALDPWTLLEIAGVLMRAEESGLAEATLQTVALFPAYYASKSEAEVLNIQMGYIIAKAEATRHTMRKAFDEPELLQSLKAARETLSSQLATGRSRSAR